MPEHREESAKRPNVASARLRRAKVRANKRAAKGEVFLCHCASEPTDFSQIGNQARE
jgi:hypothetical protein